MKIIGTFCHSSQHLFEVLVELKYVNKGAKKKKIYPVFVNPDMHIFVCWWLDFCEIGGLAVMRRRIASAKQQSGKNPFGFPAAIFFKHAAATKEACGFPETEHVGLAL